MPPTSLRGTTKTHDGLVWRASIAADFSTLVARVVDCPRVPLACGREEHGLLGWKNKHHDRREGVQVRSSVGKCKIRRPYVHATLVEELKGHGTSRLYVNRTSGWKCLRQ